MNVILLSLNSRRLDNFIENKLYKLDSFTEITDVYIFDVFEVLNGIVFNKYTMQKQNINIEQRIDFVYNHIYKNLPTKGSIIRYSGNKKELKFFLSLVYKEYFTNSSFESHLKNQIFRNLQPKLREIDVVSKRSDLMDILSPFLLAEIAYYLYIYDTGKYKRIYGLENEMEIIQAIKNGKYENFMPYINHKIEYCKIEF